MKVSGAALAANIGKATTKIDGRRCRTAEGGCLVMSKSPELVKVRATLRPIEQAWIEARRGHDRCRQGGRKNWR